MIDSFREKRPLIVFILTFTFIFSTLISFYMFYKEKEETRTSKKANLLMLNIVNEIQSKISQGITVIDSQIVLLKQNNYNTKNFDIWAKNLMKGKDALACIQIAKDGIVSNIYPYEAHKTAMGHNLLEDKRRDDSAMLAIEKREIIFVGPVKLMQNEKYALIARKPIFINNNQKEKFWGFSIVILYVDGIMKSLEEKIIKNGFEYKLEGFNPDMTNRPLLSKSKNFTEENSLKFEVVVPNGKWIFHLQNSEK